MGPVAFDIATVFKLMITEAKNIDYLSNLQKKEFYANIEK